MSQSDPVEIPPALTPLDTIRQLKEMMEEAVTARLETDNVEEFSIESYKRRGATLINQLRQAKYASIQSRLKQQDSVRETRSRIVAARTKLRSTRAELACLKELSNAYRTCEPVVTWEMSIASHATDDVKSHPAPTAPVESVDVEGDDIDADTETKDVKMEDSKGGIKEPGPERRPPAREPDARREAEMDRLINLGRRKYNGLNEQYLRSIAEVDTIKAQLDSIAAEFETAIKRPLKNVVDGLAAAGPSMSATRPPPLKDIPKPIQHAVNTIEGVRRTMSSRPRTSYSLGWSDDGKARDHRARGTRERHLEVTVPGGSLFFTHPKHLNGAVCVRSTPPELVNLICSPVLSSAPAPRTSDEAHARTFLGAPILWAQVLCSLTKGKADSFSAFAVAEELLKPCRRADFITDWSASLGRITPEVTTEAGVGGKVKIEVRNVTPLIGMQGDVGLSGEYLVYRLSMTAGTVNLRSQLHIPTYSGTIQLRNTIINGAVPQAVFWANAVEVQCSALAAPAGADWTDILKSALAIARRLATLTVVVADTDHLLRGGSASVLVLRSQGLGRWMRGRRLVPPMRMEGGRLVH